MGAAHSKEATLTPTVVVRCGGTLLALPLAGIVEVFRMVAMSARLPRAPRHCLGVVDHHGSLVPVFDLGARLGLQPPRDDEGLVDGHVLLVEDEGLARLSAARGGTVRVGYAVDEVRELIEVELQPLPETSMLGPAVTAAVRCADGRLAPLLPHGTLLTVVQRSALRAALDALSAGGAG